MSGKPDVGTRGRLVDLGRTFHIQSFVRALVVEDLNKFVEAGLLLQEVGGRRLGGFFLQGEMHALMTTILLGSTGVDPLDANPPGEATRPQVRSSGTRRVPKRREHRCHCFFVCHNCHPLGPTGLASGTQYTFLPLCLRPASARLTPATALGISPISSAHLRIIFLNAAEYLLSSTAVHLSRAMRTAIASATCTDPP